MPETGWAGPGWSQSMKLHSRLSHGCRGPVLGPSSAPFLAALAGRSKAKVWDWNSCSDIWRLLVTKPIVLQHWPSTLTLSCYRAVWSWTSSFPSLNLGFVICETEGQIPSNFHKCIAPSTLHSSFKEACAIFNYSRYRYLHIWHLWLWLFPETLKARELPSSVILQWHAVILEWKSQSFV